LENIGPVPSPAFARAPGLNSRVAAFGPMELLNDLHNWSVPAARYLGRHRVVERENGESNERSYVTGWGTRNPYYTLPQGFQLRLGRAASDPFYSGVYE